MLSRGDAKIVDEIFTRKQANNGFVESYQETDISQLKEMGRDDDRMALITLAQRRDAMPEDWVWAGRNLVILGDTQNGLGALVQDRLHKAGVQFKKVGTADSEVKRHLVSALAMVEYGLRRQDTFALENYLIFKEEYEDFMYGLNPDQFFVRRGFGKSIRDRRSNVAICG